MSRSLNFPDELRELPEELPGFLWGESFSYRIETISPPSTWIFAVIDSRSDSSPRTPTSCQPRELAFSETR